MVRIAWAPLRRRWPALAAVVAVLVAAGVVAMIGLTGDRPETPTVTGATAAAPTASPSSAAPTTPPPGASLTGPLNLLLVGVDTRVSQPGWEPHGDAVLVLHVPKGLDRAYLFSLPRDLLVDIPAFAKAGYRGGRTKLTHAMSYGSRVPGKPKQPSAAQGYELLRSTVSGYTGLRIDAGAVITFGGFDKLVDTLGGVDLYVDQRVVSQHRRPDGTHRDLRPGGGGYVGPQMVYEKGDRHLNGWQALDYARQRYVTGGDYTRQRHQQQLVKALVSKILDEDLARQPDRVEQVVAALGDTLIYAGGPRIVDIAYALGGMSPDRFTAVGLPGAGVGRGSGYQGEQLTQVGRKFLTELRAGRAEAYLAAHPELRVRN
ncbi:LCP family protein [Micromonospora endolithica]|uniref:LytR family transcriptional regulator n=1 Tax=Micromonospora endolithica TaxID=230091 RepID=A0A3A9ZAV6_9ACTN|nr:LCP family protein [Micromonospora endolithica]RKN44437.1 LytR family transcriptional regulator [Micromonospora endolithica]TWJ25934.1 LytR family transcriptional attenuator [Micromonospora endolithica]